MLKQMERHGSISETTDRERHGECTQAASRSLMQNLSDWLGKHKRFFLKKHPLVTIGATSMKINQASF